MHDSANVTGSDSEDNRSRVGGGGQRRGPRSKGAGRGRHGLGVGGLRETKNGEREGENKRCQFADERLGSQKAI